MLIVTENQKKKKKLSHPKEQIHTYTHAHTNKYDKHSPRIDGNEPKLPIVTKNFLKVGEFAQIEAILVSTTNPKYRCAKCLCYGQGSFVKLVPNKLSLIAILTECSSVH